MDAIHIATPADARAGATATRFWEIDALRGLAVAAMVFFHLMWDLWFFGLTAQDIASPAWQSFARSIGGTFIFVMGVSLALTGARLRERGGNLSRWALRRGAMIFGLGLVISLATFAAVGDAWVRFGILHFAGAAILLSPPFVRLRAPLVALIGILALAVGHILNGLSAPWPWLLPLGVAPRDVRMVDYYPLLPWFGVMLLGIAAGKVAYASGVRRFSLPDLSTSTPVRALSLAGRHSLLIYLAHQPILISALLLLRWVEAI